MSIGVRVSDKLYELAKEEGSKNMRSASKQIEYWANLGAEVEGRLEKEKREIAPTSPA